MERTHCIHTSHNEIHKIPICRGFGSRDSEYYGNWNSVQKYLAKNTRKHAVCNTQHSRTVQIKRHPETARTVYGVQRLQYSLVYQNARWRNALLQRDENDKNTKNHRFSPVLLCARVQIDTKISYCRPKFNDIRWQSSQIQYENQSIFKILNNIYYPPCASTGEP